MPRFLRILLPDVYHQQQLAEHFPKFRPFSLLVKTPEPGINIRIGRAGHGTVCFYGLYAALNSDYLLDHGADSCLGGEYEKPLVALVESIESGSTDDVEGVIRRGKKALPVLEKLSFATPTRWSQ